MDLVCLSNFNATNKDTGKPEFLETILFSLISRVQNFVNIKSSENIQDHAATGDI